MKGRTCYPKIDSSPNSIFSKVIEKRKNRITKNVFIQKENQFDFGPLLILNKKNNSEEIQKNFSIFTLKNPTEFVLKINFSFLNEPIKQEVQNIKSNHKNKENSESQELQNHVFNLDQKELEIKPNEQKLLKVFSCPTKEQIYKDSLFICIEENPEPIVIPLKCEGQFPRIQADTKEIDFGKQLVGKTISKNIILTNITLLPVKWKLNNPLNFFQINKTEGLLDPEKEDIISLTFDSQLEKVFEESILLQVEDNENKGVINSSLIKIDIKGEGFFIKTEISGFEEETPNLFNFGNIEVSEKKDKKILLKNTGIYEIGFEMEILKKAFKKVFSIEPSYGKLAPNEEIEIVLTFCSDNEILLESNPTRREIILKILDSISGNLYEEKKIMIKANCQFCQFNINPVKSLNFGPIIFGENKTKYFQINNTGLFDFHYYICNWEDRLIAKSEFINLMNPVESSKQNNSKNKIEKNYDYESEYLKISPKFGKIKINNFCQIKVDFCSQNKFLMEKQLCILISNRNLKEYKDGIEYFILGESCVPGIETNNFNSIFEEQMVVPSLNSTGMNIQDILNKNVFSIEEKTFYFGHFIPSKYPNGVQERFKLINNGKVPVNVSCSIKKREKSSEFFNFSVSPSQTTINPNEFVYFKVKFTPEIMATYSGIFEAIVENGDPMSANHSLKFDLKGKGCLPTLLIDQNSDYK